MPPGIQLLLQGYWPFFKSRGWSTLTPMNEPVDDDVLLKKLYPDLSDDERAEVREFLNAYCELVLRICEREERERRGLFDAPLLGP